MLLGAAEVFEALANQPAVWSDMVWEDRSNKSVDAFDPLHQVHVETILRQTLRGLRRVSYQLPCFNSILECAFEDSGDNACVRAGLSGVFGAHRRCPDELEVERCGSLQDIAADGGLELGAVVQLSAAWVVAATLSQRGLRGGQRPASADNLIGSSICKGPRPCEKHAGRHLA